MRPDDRWYLEGFTQGTRTIREFKRTQEEVRRYLEFVQKAKCWNERLIAWNRGRLDACRIALAEDIVL